jgi:hypothetical protein
MSCGAAASDGDVKRLSRNGFGGEGDEIATRELYQL